MTYGSYILSWDLMGDGHLQSRNPGGGEDITLYIYPYLKSTSADMILCLLCVSSLFAGALYI